ncbi:tail terminator protein [Pseudomonas phage PMBT14]|uniref:Tail terminator protein n=1 Tax=Pseudomonas phage PMBT14 TaxID=2059855 RepID=A0A2I6PI58_9CAUD|nr:tail terminator [Pseudomonas phage PMBT14]AUM59729.1 tail terminator protein [Pseudomonas phage PMBT14]UOL48374.1 tail terminator protein [Pseudomonas phage Almagne]
MSQTQVYQALIAAIKAVPNMVPFGTQGTPWKPPSNVGYADVSIIQNPPSAYTLGDEGEDMVDGIAQVLLKYPVDKGVLTPSRLGDSLRESFKAGRRIFFEDQEVIIRSSGLGRFDDMDGKLVNPFTIYWYALIRR